MTAGRKKKGFGCFVPLLLLWGATPASAQQVRITGLTDVAFGAIANLSSDITVSRNVCAYSTAAGSRYHLTASGSGAGGSFNLVSGANTLAYEVQWAGSINQTAGTALSAGVASPVFTSTATRARCQSGPTASASLITILRATALGSARAGSYSGVLTLILAPN